LSCDNFIQLVDQVLAEHPRSSVAVAIETAAVDAIDKINGRYVVVREEFKSH
jgi:hypothetical protein